jgi:hypothetical protein
MQALAHRTREKLLDHLRTMDGRAIPNEKQLTWDLAQQLDKPHDILGLIGSLLHVHEKPSLWGDPSDRGKMIAGQLHPQHGSLPARCIGPHRHRQQIKTRFIDKDYRAVFLLGFFFSRGQCWTFQCAIACSLRWVARSTGFCML